jgi:hypothetical protein
MLTWMLAMAAGAATDVVVDVVPGRLNHGSVSGTVAMPISEVVGKVMDCEGTSDWFPNLYGTRLVEADAHAYRCSGSTDLPWPLSDRTWSIDVEEDRNADGDLVIRFAYVPGSGNLAEMRGAYVLRAVGDATEVRYTAGIDLGVWVPQAIVEWATRQLLPGILDGLEQGAGSELVAAVR